MKLQAITLIAVFSGIITSTSADAGKFNLGDALKVAQQFNNGPKYGGGGNPGFGGGNPGYVKPLPQPLPHPGHGGGKPPICKPPIHLPTPPPVYCPPPVKKPCPPPVVICPPVKKPCPPVCPPPVHVCPKPPVCPPPCNVCPKCHCEVCHCHKPICKPPVNRPPMKCFTMKLMNNAGAEVYYNLNKADDYAQMPVEDVDLIKSHTPKPHLISYHNGQEVVEFELDPSAAYSFEWQGETLMLMQIQG